MLELGFKAFMFEVEKNEKRQNVDRRILHYSESNTSITLYLKSVDYWEYITKVSIQDIVGFGNTLDISEVEAIRAFKTSILYDAVNVNEKVPEVEGFNKKITDYNNKEGAIIDAGKDVEDEAKSYDELLSKSFQKWENKVMSFIDHTLKDELSEKSYNKVEKTLGEFFSGLFNAVNTSGFMTKLKRVISLDLKVGISSAEKELNTDIGISADFGAKVQQLANRQLDGFYIDGKRWKGLKGVASDLQLKVSEIVRDGVVDKKSLAEVKNEIKDVFTQYKGGKVKGKVTSGRAMRIARTETNRFVSDAKLDSYKRSGLKGVKVWSAFIDTRTSDQSKRLNGQKQPLEKPFVDPKTGQEFMHPPHQPNDRCTMKFVQQE